MELGEGRPVVRHGFAQVADEGGDEREAYQEHDGAHDRSSFGSSVMTAITGTASNDP